MRIKYDGSRDEVYLPELQNLQIRKGTEFDCPDGALAARLLKNEGMSEVLPAPKAEPVLEPKAKKAKAKKLEGEE